jgi:hypothetical protein
MAHLRASTARPPDAAFDDTLATALSLRCDIRADCRPVCRLIGEAKNRPATAAVESLDNLADYPDATPAKDSQ